MIYFLLYENRFLILGNFVAMHHLIYRHMKLIFMHLFVFKPAQTALPLEGGVRFLERKNNISL